MVCINNEYEDVKVEWLMFDQVVPPHAPLTIDAEVILWFDVSSV